MSENILIEVSPGETRIAFTDDRNRLREFQIERVADKSLIEGVYRGRVAKLERGINGAFVDIGTGIDVFLNRVKGIHEGEWLIVQVFREAVAGKSPAARREISIAGRYVVFRPGGLGVHWPKKLKFGRKRAELDRVFESVELLKEGWTVRSQAAHAPERQILQEMERLRRRWTEAKKVEGDCLLAPTNLVERVLRDRASIDSMITVDDRRLFFKLSRNKMSEWPEVGRNLAFYEKDIPIFAAYGLADEIETLTEKEVALLRGGRITIDLTEAMTVIDVDMGGAGGDSLKEDAVLSVNLSAASEIARQIRLRNLSGLIVVDFINMRQRSRGLKIINAMRQAFYDSAVPVDVLGMTSGGLLEITRRRDGPTIYERLLAPSTSEIRLSKEYVVCEALRCALKEKAVGGICLVVPAGVASLLRGEFAEAFEETKRRIGGALELRESDNEDLFRIETNARSGI